MSKDTNRILEKIKQLEAEKARLIPLRKEEIFNVLESNGGLTLDNKLLAGLAIFASDPANANSDIVRKLTILGQNKIPSKPYGKGNRNIAGRSDKEPTVQSNAINNEKAHG